MIGYNAELSGLMQNIETWRRRELDRRESLIREQADRLERGPGRLRGAGVLPDSDPLFGRPVVPVAEPDPVGLSRGAVFARLRSGGSAEGLNAEYVSDYQRSAELLHW